MCNYSSAVWCCSMWSYRADASDQDVYLPSKSLRAAACSSRVSSARLFSRAAKICKPAVKLASSVLSSVTLILSIIIRWQIATVSLRVRGHEQLEHNLYPHFANKCLARIRYAALACEGLSQTTKHRGGDAGCSAPFGSFSWGLSCLPRFSFFMLGLFMPPPGPMRRRPRF